MSEKLTGNDKAQEIMDVRQAAKYLGLGESSIYKLAKKGEIPHVKLLSSIRFPKAALDEWIEAQARKNIKK